MRESRHGEQRWEREVVALGGGLVRALFIALKTAANYEKNHPAMNTPADGLVRQVREFSLRREEASLVMGDDHLFCSEIRLKPAVTGMDAFLFVVRTMKNLSLGSMSFSPAAGPADFDEFVHILAEVENMDVENRYMAVTHLMEKRGVDGIDVELLQERTADVQDVERNWKERAKSIYSRTLGVVSEVMDAAKLGKTLKYRKSKRVVQGLIDTLLTAETNLLGLTTIRCHDEYTYNHSVNVGILSLAIGQRIGLPKTTLVELGMAAIFHDIGKSCIPLQILNKPSSFDEDEWNVMKRHPVFGVKELLRLKGADALTARIMMGAFEHHMNYDFSGYPAVPYGKPISLFGRIVAIADCYDAVSSSRVYSREAWPPEKTLQLMLTRSGTYYDPILMKLFVNCVGIFPVGTLCLLTSRELAVVMECHPDPDKWNLPKVKIISGADGEIRDGALVNLGGKEEKRRIVRTVDAGKYDIDVARYFV